MQQKAEKVCVDEGCGNLEYFYLTEKYEQCWVNNGLVLPPCVDIYSLLWDSCDYFFLNIYIF